MMSSHSLSPTRDSGTISTRRESVWVRTTDLPSLVRKVVQSLKLGKMHKNNTKIQLAMAFLALLWLALVIEGLQKLWG
jgi:hypothetical protein